MFTTYKLSSRAMASTVQIGQSAKSATDEGAAGAQVHGQTVDAADALCALRTGDQGDVKVAVATAQLKQKGKDVSVRHGAIDQLSGSAATQRKATRASKEKAAPFLSAQPYPFAYQPGA